MVLGLIVGVRGEDGGGGRAPVHAELYSVLLGVDEVLLRSSSSCMSLLLQLLSRDRREGVRQAGR